jgi:hypothetical protein
MRATNLLCLALALALAGPGRQLAASSFSWTAGADVTVPLLNSEDACPGIVQDGPNLSVQVSLYPDWYRFSGTTLDNLTAQPEAVRDASFTQPNGDDAYWTDGIWQDPGGTRYAIIHVEYDYAVPRTAFLWKRRIGLASSTDKGATWHYVGDILTTNPNRPGSPDTTACQDFGCGDTYLFVDRRGGYFYLYYMTAWVNSSSGTRTNQVMSVARCSISDELAPGKWQKWSGGAWTQPGLGGAEDPVFIGTDMSVVHFNTYLNAFVAIGHDSGGQAWITTCSDITQQNWQTRDYSFPQRLYWYNWPVDPVTHDPYEMGQNIRLYSAQANYNGVGTKYFPITFSNGNASPAVSVTAPAEGAVSFTSSPLTLVATASASDASIAKVEFFANQSELGTVSTPPYTFVWPNAPAGQYRIFARATDTLNEATDSAGVDVTVTPITYPLWKVANGIAPTVPDNAVQSNGLSPLLSYALNISNVAQLPQAQMAAGMLTLSYTPWRSDVTYSVEASTDLAAWSANLVNQGAAAPGSGLITASAPVQLNNRLFLHLKVSYP